ncbi:MAG: Vi polysaccharide biosynthesis UDP-N-acetylglucosamine C-6 dehydrogenase TviB [Legionella sp.]
MNDCLKKLKLVVMGLGYVGLPLAVAFGKIRSVVGFDINSKRIRELESGSDHTLEISPQELAEAAHLSFTDDLSQISDCNVFIVTVPTPIDQYKRPDFNPLISATHMLASVLKVGDIIIYESTVYPGAIEDVCVPLIEATTQMVFNQDFFVGYSPERANPGDKKHRLSSIVKVTSGSTPEVADLVDTLYQEICLAGTHKASSIKVAEAAKVIENTQRDVNIALMNELAILFNKLNIDTEEVLKAAETKWNFLSFRPGLVGGHCIGVDPYYLTHKAAEVGYYPEVILASRHLNDKMGSYIVSQLIKLMLKKQIPVNRARILIMGLTFKENCPDLRNSRVMDIIDEFKEYNVSLDVYEPWVASAAAEQEYGISLIQFPRANAYDAIILAVAHHQFIEMGESVIRGFGKEAHVLYDIKHILPITGSDLRL